MIENKFNALLALLLDKILVNNVSYVMKIFKWCNLSNYFILFKLHVHNSDGNF